MNILSLDLGITSIGYSILEKKENNRYSLIDYGVSMFDAPFDKDGKSKKLLHSTNTSMSNLYAKKKQRKKVLARLFEEFGLAKAQKLLQQEKQNIYKNKWQLRCKDVFERKLNIGEFFTILYFIAKHRGYKSLDTNELLEELCEELKLDCGLKSSQKDDEKGKIKQALKRVEELKQNTNKTVAQIIYEIESKKQTPTFRNHDNYNYMIRREYIEDELKKLVESQVKFGLFGDTFDIEKFINELKEIIVKQKESSNDLNLFANCEYYKEHKVANQYSVVADIFKMYESVTNIKLNKEKITKEQIQLIADDFFTKIKKGKNIPDIKYKDIRKILKLSDDIKIFDKKDSYVRKGKTIHHTITKFHFLNNLSKFDNSFIVENLKNLENLAEIFEVLNKEKSPKTIFEQLKGKVDEKTIIELIKYKNGKSLNISHYAMLKFIPYFQEGLTTDEIKKKLDLNRNEDYSKYKKGIKYLHVNQFEKDDNLEINNHPVKYIVSAVMRVVKHLHTLYGPFDEIKVESTRELSLPKKVKDKIDKVNKDNEAKYLAVLKNEAYLSAAKYHNKNIQKYKEQLVLYEEQEGRDIYTWQGIEIDDIFKDKLEVDHIVPQSLGGLSVKHNKVLCFKNSNATKGNRLPMNYIKDTESFRKNIEYLYTKKVINGKKLKNLLATNLDEIYKDTFESKSLRATSYVEALTAQMLKRYYPFADKQKQKDGNAVMYIQGRATANIRKLLHVKAKTRGTNIHHAIDALIIGVTSHSWLKKISNTFRENYGVIDDKARENIKKELPLIEGVSVAELVAHIEENYNFDGEESVFYRDIFGNVKVVPFWVSKKTNSSRLHEATIYGVDKIKGKKTNLYTGYTTLRVDIIKLLKDSSKKPKLPKIGDNAEYFLKDYEEYIIKKLYVYQYNKNDKIIEIVKEKGIKIFEYLKKYENLDKTSKELKQKVEQELSSIIDEPLVDYNGNIIRKVKIIYSNKKNEHIIRGGTTVAERTGIGLNISLKNNKLQFKRIDFRDKLSNNIGKICNEQCLNVYRNDVVVCCFKKSEKNFIACFESFNEKRNTALFFNSKFPKKVDFQPKYLLQGKSRKEFGIKSMIGIIKLNLDILGNIKSFSSLGEVDSELLSFLKKLKD